MVEFPPTEYRTCPAFLVQDRDTQGVYRLCDFITTPLIPPDQAHHAGKVNSVDRLHPATEFGPPERQKRSLLQCSCSC